MNESIALGPLQLLVFSFEGNQFRGEILPELRRLREHDIVRLIDLLFVARDLTGDVEVLQKSDLTPEEAQRFGAVVGSLIGLGAGGEAGARAGAEVGAEAFEHGVHVQSETVWNVAERIPIGSSAAIVLLEHRWAMPLRDAITRAQGVSVVDEWIGPADLIAAGLETSDLDAAAASIRPAPTSSGR